MILGKVENERKYEKKKINIQSYILKPLMKKAKFFDKLGRKMTNHFSEDKDNDNTMQDNDKTGYIYLIHLIQ